VRKVISSRGQSLDTDIQRTMKDRMGDSFSDVQIHTGPRAAQACDQINARAFTVGNNIAFNQGEFDLESPEGQHVLVHELAHVRQQTGGAVSMLPQENLALEIDPDPRLEEEAEETAQRVMAGGELGIQRMQDTEVHVQRLPEGKALEALALFEAELKGEGEVSDHRQKHNELQFSYLSEIAGEVVEKRGEETKLDVKQDDNPSVPAAELKERWANISIAEIKQNIEDLETEINNQLQDVALTEDQRMVLHGNVEIDKWDKVGWTLAKPLLVSVGIPKLLEIADVAEDAPVGDAMTGAEAGSQAKGFDPNVRGVQTVAQIRRGEVNSLEDLKEIWKQTNGTLEERAEQIAKEIRDGTWYDEGEDPTGVRSNQK